MAVPAEHPLLGIARIAAEQFVAAVAGEHPAMAVLAGEPGAEVGRQHRRVAEGLVIGGRHVRNVGDQIVGGDVVGAMLDAEMLRGDARELHLVVAVGLDVPAPISLAFTKPLCPLSASSPLTAPRAATCGALRDRAPNPGSGLNDE